MDTRNNGDSEFDPSISLNDLQRVSVGEVRGCETNGIRANRNKVFTFELSGPEVYELTGMLRKLAIESRCYPDIEAAVKYERLLFRQAHQQGF